VDHRTDEVSAVEQRTNTIQFGCKVMASRVRLTLDHVIETIRDEQRPDRIRICTRMTSCSGAASCGWKLAHIDACPFRTASGI
jgi:hypothetical protein